MKNIAIALVLLFVVSCSNNYEAPPYPFQDVSYYSSLSGRDLNLSPVQAGTNLTFIDFSQGALSHEWSIETGNFYLKEKFPTTTGADLTPYIDTEKGLTTTDAKAHVLFPNVGTFKITLTNTYSEKVTYKGAIPIDAVKVGDVWVFTKVFEITVKAKVN
ncbi:hypothetical protein [Flavobacterium algicola]|uniref:hypothetical protein n=1 Tax=Flavobacterium algicola TaxID=556529 RepID=UPI001EFDD62E|nr:hypothetical protein [Flavobacterium algicola]MCG9793729.1 hypothetical protein [Flavobacterium algicola]